MWNYNQMVRRIIAQMSLEAELHHHLAPTNWFVIWLFSSLNL